MIKCVKNRIRVQFGGGLINKKILLLFNLELVLNTQTSNYLIRKIDKKL